MNKQLEYYGRCWLKNKLAILTQVHRTSFKRMYSYAFKTDKDGATYVPPNGKCDMNKDIDIVVDELPADRLNWAMNQVENSLLGLDQKTPV